ncbi:hypothetical protein R1flu_021056 [Riccia fluitans]|uniref:Uncharacterized protein n=1 Tax=Riccia fluitans TaxID=41844 RepID=A0ABD1ZNA3_9MARC
MAARRAASALRARVAALLTAVLWAVAAAQRTANILKCPRGHFRVRQWEKDRESGEALGGVVQYLEEIGLV